MSLHHNRHLPIMVQRYEKRGKLQNFSENIFELRLPLNKILFPIPYFKIV